MELVKDAEQRAVTRHREWEAQRLKWAAEREAQERRDAAERHSKGVAASNALVAQIVHEWSVAIQAEAFFDEAQGGKLL